MSVSPERLTQAIRDLRQPAERRPAGPEGEAGDDVAAWADRVMHHIFDLVDVDRMIEADALAHAALDTFSEIGDQQQLPRFLAILAVTNLATGRISDAFEHAVRALSLSTDGQLPTRSAASTANSLGMFFERLGAWDMAIERYEHALANLDLGSPSDRARVELTTQNLVVCLHESLANGRPMPDDARAARLRRLDELARPNVPAGRRTATPAARHATAIAAATVALAGDRAVDALETLRALEDDHHRMIRRDELVWRLLGARALLASDQPDEAHRWATEAVQLAEGGDGIRVAKSLRTRATIRWALGDQPGAFADSTAAGDSMAELRADGVARLAASLTDRAGLEHARRELRERSAALADSAGRDALTGLANRRALDEQVALMSETDAPVAVLMIDLDRFKLVNDTHGHAVGDEVLVRCAELLQQATRPADLVVRLGGDEFVVVLLDGRGRPEQVGDRIRRAAHEHRWAATAADLTMTVSVGVAAGHGRELTQLVEQADEALYAAKRAGRDRVITAG